MSEINFDITKFHIPMWQELPNIDLYMDQVLTYIEKNLSNYIKLDKDEKFITKTMINNYVKQEIIPPPVSKKYNRLHLAELFVICILKQVYSISEINSLIKLALKTAPPKKSYNHFCHVLEDSLKSTFNGMEYSVPSTLTNEQYILKNVVQTFVNKLYVQIAFLKK